MTGRRPPPQAILLFDIDGTLLDTAGAGRRALERALGIWLGRPVDTSGYDYTGRTDLEILRALWVMAGEPYPDEATRRRVLESYVSNLGKELATDTRGRACPGIPGLLQALDRDPRWSVGLLTGNLARAAEVKLRHFGLDRFFSFGAFGDDGEDRRALVPVALCRQEERTGIPLPASRTILVGDTERDIGCARAGGARVLAVATGFRSMESLRRANPDALLADLSDLPRVMQTIEGLVL